MPEIIGASLQLDASQASASVGSFKAELKKAQAEVITLTEKFGATSLEATNAAKRAAELKDRIGDAKKLVDSFNPDEKFRGFSQALTGVAGGFTAITGAMGLLGIESQDVQKQLLKVQSALALSQGLNTIGDSIQSFKNLGATLVQTLGKSGLIGLAIAGVAALGLAISGIFDKQVKLTEGQKAYNDTLKDYKAAASNAIQKVEESKVAFELAEKGVISKEKALKVYNDTLGDSLGKTDDLATAEKNLANKADDYIKITSLKAQANALFAKSAEKSAEALINQQQLEKSGLADVKKSAGIFGGANNVLGEVVDKIKKDIATAKNDAVDIEKIGANLLKQAETLSAKSGVKNTDKADVSLTAEAKSNADKAAADAKAAGAKRIEAEKATALEIEKLRQENFLKSIADERSRQEIQVIAEFENEKDRINALKINEKLKADTIVELRKQRETKLAEIQKTFDDKAAADAKAVADKQAEIEKNALEKLKQLRNDNALAAINTGKDVAQATIEQAYKDRVAEIGLLKETEQKKTELLAEALAARDKQLAAHSINSADRIEQEYQASIAEINLLKETEEKKTQLLADAKIERDKKLLSISDTGIQKAKIEQDYQNAIAEINLLKDTEEKKTQLLIEAKADRDKKLSSLNDTGVQKARINQLYKDRVAEIAVLKETEERKTELLAEAAVARDKRLSMLSNTNVEKAKIEQIYKDSVDEINAMKAAEGATLEAVRKFEETKTALITEAKIKRDQQLADLDKQLQDKRAALQIELDNSELDSFALKSKQLEDWYKERLKIVEAGSKEEKDLIENYENQKSDLLKDRAQARLAIIADILGKAADLVGKQTAAGKALAVAEATINTYAGATAALRSKVPFPEPIATAIRIAQAGLIIATGLKSIKAIVNTKVPGGGSGGASVPSEASISPSAPLQPTPQIGTTQLDQNSINAVGNAANPVRAFVLESDVTTGQERIRALNRAAKLGG